ncbi:LOW QUALITY PROTEIN: protein phosphatase 1 regulatory subunit 36 [Meleagris gallopavo]|uniref:LOW QUALITY PROTEIN: protein phosphatase 1 regulatory subunit 36 n=1 Tax=Meleagris gallopavo TaxID=9103 RepID=UPI0012ABDD4A|nr:LOW QUALITY PROTEIN: protein phosphatase 1 regulatory subunit 36 [Meleagris gallopavo]
MDNMHSACVINILLSWAEKKGTVIMTCNLHAVFLQTIKLTSGVWYWKDDTNTLEFASSSPTAEENLSEGKNAHFQEICVKTLKSIFQDERSATLPEKRLAGNEEKIHMLAKWIKHEYVTLDDVKYLAFLLREENESHRMLPFAAVMGNKKLDEFLMALLFYMSFYLEKIALEKKTQSLILSVIFLENKAMDDVLAKLAVAKIYLAKVYSNFVLERGIAERSRTSHGKRKTSLQKDRNFFEGFYNFCSYVTWLVFRRKHFQVIREEIGRLLCSDMFNLAIRDRNHVSLQTADANAVRLPRQRQVGAKHPSINSMLYQHSPVLSTLLPSPKESAQYRSQSHYCRSRDPQPCSCDILPDFSQLLTTKVGIIGAHCSELNSFLLQSDGTTEEEDQDQEQREEQGKLRSHSSVPTKDLSLSAL